MAKQILSLAMTLTGLAGAFVPSDAPAADGRAPAAAEAPAGDAPERAEIDKLVRELGAPTFMTRQHAQRVLVSYGEKAKAALEAARNDPDSEIQRRAESALAAIGDIAFHVRLSDFLADKTPDNDHGLGGWNRFRALAGPDLAPAARRLFADMHWAERELLEVVDRRPAQAGPLLDARCRQVESDHQNGNADRNTPLSLGSMAAVLFAASNPDVPVSATAANCICNLGNHTTLGAVLAARPSGPIFQRLLAAWVARPFERESVVSYRNLLLAMQFGLKDAVPVALALIQPPGGQPNLEQYAILAIGKLGNAEHVSALSPLLHDERPIGVPDRNGHESDTQVRDVALATMIHLAGQPLADFGFSHAKRNSSILFNTNTLGFNNAAARDEAQKKWQAWSKEHLRQAPAP
ncbi:MAG TPA: hypothetical protein VHC22_13120 [Pirellulales bacterium]|nr:hypothetical protein [Pirellulales bacterium]